MLRLTKRTNHMSPPRMGVSPNLSALQDVLAVETWCSSDTASCCSFEGEAGPQLQDWDQDNCSKCQNTQSHPSSRPTTALDLCAHYELEGPTAVTCSVFEEVPQGSEPQPKASQPEVRLPPSCRWTWESQVGAQLSKFLLLLWGNEVGPMEGDPIPQEPGEGLLPL